MKKAAVIGVGNLGSCIAYEVANRGLVESLTLVDVVKDLAVGQADDIEQALAFRSNTRVYPGEYEDAADSDLVVITAGKPRTPEMKSRLELLEVNARIIEDVAAHVKGFNEHCVYILLTNPLDTMTYLFSKRTGVNREKVIGSAGQLDTARFRNVLSRIYDVNVMDVEAYVIGEHGEHQVPLFSRVRLRGELKSFTAVEEARLWEELRDYAIRVVAKKGATVYAPANNTAEMAQAVLRNEGRVMVCSTVLSGEYRLNDVSIGVPAVLGAHGVERILEWPLNDEETRMFYAGADALRETNTRVF